MEAAAEVNFLRMSEAGVRQWVEANPGRVNERDKNGCTPLVAAVWKKERLSLVVWLLDEKGADANASTNNGHTSLYFAHAPDIVSALLARGADPIRVTMKQKWSPLMRQAVSGTVDVVARLLQDPRVRATINVQDVEGRTALHYACRSGNENLVALTVHSLLQAGANPTLTNKIGKTPLGWVRQRHPTHQAAIALLEQALADAEKTSLLVKVRRIVVAATSNTVASSCLQGRVARGDPLPGVGLVPVLGGPNDDEEGRKLRTTLAFMCGLGREAMPRDVFGVVMDLLMPSWDPLRRKNAGAEQPLPQG